MLFTMPCIFFYCSALLFCGLSNPVFAGQTSRVSVSSVGIQHNTESSLPVISADGQKVVFLSGIRLDNTTAIFDIWAHDRTTTKTESVASGLVAQAVSDVSLSSNGRYVGFSVIDNSAKDATKQTVFFIYDRRLRKTQQVINNARGGIYMSADARYISFDGDGIFIHDRLSHKTEQVKLAIPGINLALSADARYVVFIADAPDPVKEDTNRTWDIFVHDRQTLKTERVSVSSTGAQANSGAGFRASISAEGRYVAFVSSASNLVAGDSNAKPDIFVHDRLLHKTERVNVASNGAQSNSNSINALMFPFQLSADGRYVTFISDASNLVAGDSNKMNDVFIHDRLTHKTERVSTATNGTQANNDSENMSVSADGRHVAFASKATNLVTNDTNNQADIFVRDRLIDTSRNANLSIAVTQKVDTLKPKANGDYLYTLTNNGKNTVDDVVLLHLVSDIKAINFKPSQGSCSLSSVATVCHLGGLAAKKQVTVRVAVTADSQDFSQQITVSGAPVDTIPANNYVSVSTIVK